MAIRVLLAPLFHNAEDRSALDTAFVLADRFQGHVDALFVQRSHQPDDRVHAFLVAVQLQERPLGVLVADVAVTRVARRPDVKHRLVPAVPPAFAPFPA